MLRSLIKIILLLPVILVGYHTLVRIVRRFYKFPIPEFLANLIDNPLRRRLQPPDATRDSARHRAGDDGAGDRAGERPLQHGRRPAHRPERTPAHD